MTKQDLIEALVHDAKLLRSSAIKAVEGTIKALSDAIAAGDTIAIRGFASIKVVDVPPRTWNNINTGRQKLLPASRRVKFTPSEELKNRLNQGKLD